MIQLINCLSSLLLFFTSAPIHPFHFMWFHVIVGGGTGLHFLQELLSDVPCAKRRYPMTTRTDIEPTIITSSTNTSLKVSQPSTFHSHFSFGLNNISLMQAKSLLVWEKMKMGLLHAQPLVAQRNSGIQEGFKNISRQHTQPCLLQINPGNLNPAPQT